MNNTAIRRVLDSPSFKLYSQIIGSAVTGGVFVFWLFSSQLSYLKQQNEDMEKKYKLSQELDQKKCEGEKTELRNRIEGSMLQQYKKFSKDSKESHLFLENMDLLSQKK
jgi:hypothetical protein